MKIGIIGAGNMGKAYYKALSQQFGAEQIYMCDRNEDKLAEFDRSAKTFHTDKLGAFIDAIDVLMIAVKPQNFQELSQEILKYNIEGISFISIMAGISVDNLKKNLKTDKIARAMPNLAIAYKKGVTGWVGTEEIDKSIINEILSVTGTALLLSEESLIDSIAAVSGSGPAYFFFLAEMLAEGAKELGFSADQAEILSKETFIGAATMVEKREESLTELRQAVTSKGGTTAAALNYLSENKFQEIFTQALKETIKRAKELNS